MKHTASPTNIAVDMKKKEISIAWADSFNSSYTFKQLRQNCPCAVCNDTREKAKSDPLFVFSGDITQTSSDLDPDSRVQKVGQYALQFFWADGHQAGIYTYPYLRQLAEKP